MTAVMPVCGPGLPPGGDEDGAPGRHLTGRAPERPVLRGAEVLVDQCSHGVLHGDLGLGTFEAHLAAATGSEIPAGGTLFDSRTGLALRRWCPPLLDLEPHCSPARYLARRREMGAYAAGRALLRGSGIGGFLVESGGANRSARRTEAGPYGLTSARETAAVAAGTARETVSLRALAEQAADTSGSVRAFVRETAEALHAAARSAAAFSCPADFRDERPPGLAEVHRAAGRWLAARGQVQTPAGAGADTDPAGAGNSLLREPVLLRHLLWSALVTRRPVQLHVGDPAQLERFLHATRGLGSDAVVLTRPPYHRLAAGLAAGHPHVYADVGPVPAETLAEAPFGKLLFTSHARALPELYVLRAGAFVKALREVLAEWTAEGSCTREDAVRIARSVAGGNALRIYGFDEAAAG